MASVTQAITSQNPKSEIRNPKSVGWHALRLCQGRADLQQPPRPSKTQGLPPKVFGFGISVFGFLFLASVVGCVHLPKTGSDDPMPHGAVCQIVATWNHQVVFAPDPTHNGAPTPGLAGRLYLFGQEVSFPLVEEGSLIVDLFDDTKSADTKPAVDGQPIPLEEGGGRSCGKVQPGDGGQKTL